MDETAYRQILAATHARLCPFEKSILTACAACSRAEKHNVAEREIVLCDQPQARERCIILRDALRENFMFALGHTHCDQPLPHAQEMRVQCGGLQGLQVALDGDSHVSDVAALVDTALQKFGEFADFPYAKILQSARAYQRAR